MLLSIQIYHSYDQRLDQLDVLLSHRPQVRAIIVGDKYPGGELEDLGARLFDARALFACHGMSTEETRLHGIAKDGSCTAEDFDFGAANIRQQSGWREQRTDALDKIDDATHRRCQHHNVAALASPRSIDIHLVDYTQFSRLFEDLWAVPADDAN